MKTWPTWRIVLKEKPTNDQWEMLTWRVLEELGSLGIEELPGGFDKASEDAPPHSARFFFADSDSGTPPPTASQLQALVEECLGKGIATLEPEDLEDQDWGVNWRQYFHRLQVSPRIYVGPPWEAELPPEALPDSVLVQIEPGQAFGTGTHETTQLCMRLLEDWLEPGECLLDIGTGSGILSILAVKLGAPHAIGLEYDPVCEENFYLNGKLNDVDGAISFHLSANPAEGLAKAIAAGAPQPARIICNMLSERFYPLLPAIRSMNLPLALSGFLWSERESVLEAVLANNFKPERTFQLEEWGAFLCLPN